MSKRIKKGYTSKAVNSLEESLQRVGDDEDYDFKETLAAQTTLLLTAIHMQIAMLVELIGGEVEDG